MFVFLQAAWLLRAAEYALLTWFAYSFGLIIYRLFFSPLSRFPGPKLAAATFWYEFYYDIVLGGQYTFHIADLHAMYGPVVRINPHELHVHSLDFYDQLYCAGGRRRHKWYWASRAFSADLSTFATELHEVHRMRRAALNPFFSATRVRKLEPVIQDRVDALMKRLTQFLEDGNVLRLDVAFGAYSADVIMSYAFGLASNKIEAPDFDNDFHEACINGGRQLFLARHFPLMPALIKSLPPRWMLKLNPSMTSFFQMHRNIAVQANALFNQVPESCSPDQTTTVFHEILNSKLPPEEKSVRRLATDGGALMGAGTVTTAWALTVATFYLIRFPECLRKLKQELADAGLPVISSRSGQAQTPCILPTLEQLPYLTAVVQEALRLSYGVASRLARIAPDEALTVYQDAADCKGHDKWTIPPGTPVSMTQLLIFRDERIFPSPSAFRPERWIEDARLDRYQVAFCKGSRVCLGKHLALAEVYLMLAALFSTYGSTSVRMPADVGFLELYETDDTDIECSVDAFVPLAKVGTGGVRCLVHRWED